MFNNNNKMSFNRSITKLHLILVFIFTLLVLLAFFFNRTEVSMYERTLHMYSNLSGFYSTLEQSNQNARSYLYSGSVNELNTYNTTIEESRMYATRLYEQADEQTKWKFELLDHMLDMHESSAKASFETMQSRQASDQAVYQQFSEEYELIRSTFTKYYNIVDNQVVLHLKNIKISERYLLGFALCIAGVVIVVLLQYARRSVRFITTPIATIIEHINSIKEGDYDLSKINNRFVEIDTLCLALEDMASKVKQNIQNEQEKVWLQHQLFEQEKENLKKDELLAQSELRMLQNQINPHFLFNTMNIIYKSAQREEAFVTSDIVSKTSEVLRYGLDKANHMSDLKGELESIQSYIYIQEKRFGNRIRFLFEVDEFVPNIPIPGLLIQPLVENAVIHGLKDTTKDGEILIKVSYQDALCICVSDNGIGMESLQLEEQVIQDFKTNHSKSGLGLYNVIQRVKKFYGKGASVSFQSYPDCGFEVCIEIEVEENDYVSFIDN
ncbi:hypothetical protein A4S06_02520 [Erysipelotrichaceae bacterium MTC7]|nr:hypothetical protein A4S06_02520 [Erysipelotrichaceae bacterium MTC7]